MSKGDITIREPKNLSTQTFQVAAGTTLAILAGEPVKRTAGTPEVVLGVDGDFSIDTDEWVGIAQSDSTETTSAAGTVEVYVLDGGEVLRCRAKATSDVDTAAKLLAIANDNLVFDLTGSTWTIDVGAGTSALNGMTATGSGDVVDGLVDVRVKARATMVGSKK